jgi:hypothetical protein
MGYFNASAKMLIPVQTPYAHPGVRAPPHESESRVKV